ncbi:MAG: 3-isopropylmalate dehydrogenase [Bacteroidota bacterium]
MKKSIAVLSGDGIGPEVMREAIKVLNSIAKMYDHTFEYNYGEVGACAIDSTGDPLPQRSIDLCLGADAILFGAIGHPRYDKDPNAPVRPEQGLLKLRKFLGLFANVRPVTVYPELMDNSPLKVDRLKNVDLVIFRELTGGIYFGEKSTTDDGKQASDTCTYSIEEIEQISHEAFKAAQKRRKKLTLIDKANVLETSRLWRKEVKRIATQYPDIKVDYLYVDNAAMQMIIHPRQFDVILTSNMFGDIISDEASVITGSLGLLPSASYGKFIGMFEPIHGSYPQATGKNIANPIAMILSAAMMLDYFEMTDEAEHIRQAVAWAFANNIYTRDIHPEAYLGTTEVGDIIAAYIEDDQFPWFNRENLELGSSTII